MQVRVFLCCSVCLPCIALPLLSHCCSLFLFISPTVLIQYNQIHRINQTLWRYNIMSRSPLSQTTKMGSNWRTATKRQILGNFTSSKSGGEQSSSSMASSTSRRMDGSNADHIRSMIAGLQEKHDQMIAFLKSDLEDCKLEQEEVLSTGFIKLPKSVRNMSIKDFNQQHSCDLLSLLKSKDGVVLSGTAAAAAVVSNNNHNNNNKDYLAGQVDAAAHAAGVGNNDSNSNSNSNNNYNSKDAAKKKRCFETPAPRMRGAHAPRTILRTARRGEGLYSHNGSPLAATEPGTVIATVCKKRRGNNNNESAAAAANAGTTANVEIDIGEGQYISLNDPNGVRQLDAQMKQTAASQLKVLQDQMASLMAQLNQ